MSPDLMRDLQDLSLCLLASIEVYVFVGHLGLWSQVLRLDHVPQSGPSIRVWYPTRSISAYITWYILALTFRRT